MSRSSKADRGEPSEGFPSSRALRLGLLISVPAALCVGSMASSWAQSLQRWADGDTLSADALNANFALLEARIDALSLAAEAPLTLATADARYDDLRWALLHAAAVGACAGSPSNAEELLVAQTIPRPPDRDCNDVCDEALAASGVDFSDFESSTCVAAVSVGQIRTERATGAVSVGHGYRYSCGGEAPVFSPADPDPLAFDESAEGAAPLVPPADGADARERLISGHAQYCCCGNSFQPFVPAPPDNGGGG